MYFIGLVFSGNKIPLSISDEDLPHVTLFVAAYNEKDFVESKLQNSFELDYPQGKLHHLWVTDGSDDGTPDIIREKFPDVELLHESARNGKIGAINRGISHVKTPFVVFCDANTFLNKEAVREIAACFLADENVGCVAGEKKIFSFEKDKASGAGEGIYWKYESFIKRNESNAGSTLGAAGELFAIQTKLYEHVERDTILDDFMISLRIAKRGYRVKYAPRAYASEMSSANVQEELKRKIRIASGGVQSAIRLGALLNPFRYPELSFKFISHKILRWLVVPFCLIAIFILNFLLIDAFDLRDPYVFLFGMQFLFYLIALVGYVLETRKIRFKLLFVPYYIVIMNYAAILGLVRYVRGRQSVNWVRAKREAVG